MSGRVLRFDDPEHEAVEALLPWFVNGTLDVDECSLVERHLKDCTRCQHEADSLRELKTAYGESGMVPDAAQSLRRLRRKLDKPRARRLLPRLFDLTRFGRQSWLWVQWVVAGELAVILVLGMLLVFSGRPTTLYQTLGAADVPRHVAGSLVVVFDPRITEEELRRIVQTAGARIVDGPTGAGAYVLELPAEGQTAALDALRSERAVLLAQRLTPERAK